MAAYLLAEALVSDSAAYASYRQLEQAAVAAHHGRYLVCDGASEVLEGNWSCPEKLVVIEFASVEQVKTFYNSVHYEAARVARKDAVSMSLLVVQGLPL